MGKNKLSRKSLGVRNQKKQKNYLINTMVRVPFVRQLGTRITEHMLEERIDKYTH